MTAPVHRATAAPVEARSGDVVARPDPVAPTAPPVTQAPEVAPPVAGTAPTAVPAPAIVETASPLAQQVAARVEVAVEALRNAPPPREAVVDVDGLRVTVRIVGEHVQVAVDQPTAPRVARELADALAARGLQLQGSGAEARSGDGTGTQARAHAETDAGTGRGTPQRRDPDETPAARPAPRPVAPATDDDVLL